MSTSTTKYGKVRDALAEAIQRGEYTAGQKLPGERVLATSFGISYMTARRAVYELIQMGILERRPWEGVFVVSDSKSPVSTTTTLNVITVGHEPPHVQTLKRLAARDA